MSLNSSHLRNNYINFSSNSEEKQAALVASKHSKCSGGDINPLNAELNPICHLLALLGNANIVVVSRLRVKNVHIIGIGEVQTSSDSFRHVKYSRSATATEQNWDVTETFLSVWTSPFTYIWENFTDRWRSATERKRDYSVNRSLSAFLIVHQYRSNQSSILKLLHRLWKCRWNAGFLFVLPSVGNFLCEKFWKSRGCTRKCVNHTLQCNVWITHVPT